MYRNVARFTALVKPLPFFLLSSVSSVIETLVPAFPGGATATIGGQPAAVSFAGLAPRLVGVFQVNVQVPNLAAGNYPLAITVGGVTSNSATIGVSAAP